MNTNDGLSWYWLLVFFLILWAIGDGISIYWEYIYYKGYLYPDEFDEKLWILIRALSDQWLLIERPWNNESYREILLRRIVNIMNVSIQYDF